MDQSTPSPTRRTVIVGAATTAALTGVALTASACGSSSETAAPSVAPATGAAGDDAGATGADSAALAKLDQVPVGSGVVVGDVVLTQKAAGDVEAFSTKCPHRGCAVGVNGAKLSCPCHHSAFDLSGELVNGPATRGLTPVAVRVEGENVVRA